MNTAYAPDNTRSSIVVILSLALAAALIAVLIGLSDKPDVDTIAVAAGASTSLVSPANSDDSADFGFSVDDPADQSASAEAPTATAQPSAVAPADETAAAAGTETDESAAAEAIVVPTSEPTATPEVAAAVPRTDEPGDDQAADEQSATVAPGLPDSSGSVEGSFFTRPDEEKGAVVGQNLITVSFSEDGSGSFQGVLDITYANGAHVLLNMSGPLVWTPTTPQVKATLTGAYTFDAPIDADDVTSDDAELSITSLETGSGSLCTPKCFGFTFPPQ